MEKIITDVLLFCETAGHITKEKMTDSRKEFRMALIKEEVGELETALAADNKKEEVDAIIDSIYVLVGLAVERGYHKNLSEAWGKIQESNMSKFCETEEIAKDTVAHYKRRNQDCSYEQVGSYWVVKRPDGKVLKSILWKKPIFNL
jgi:hypothetical protein